MIGIIDYGMGNLRSVEKAFERIGAEVRVCRQPADLKGCDRWVLPGVGAFRDAIAELRRLEFVEPILDHLQRDRPFLGICLGLQLLMERSYEDGVWEGLGVLAGDVVRFPDEPGRKVPHMGWNRAQAQAKPGAPDLWSSLGEEPYFYFVHSYFVAPRDTNVIFARTDYGAEFVSAIQRGRLFATQFHPEKSQKLGLRLLQNFAESA